MVLVTSSCPSSRGCTHMFLSTPSLSSSLVKGLSVLEIKVLNGEMLMICISVLRALKRVKSALQMGEEMHRMFLGSRKQKSA